MFEKYSNNKIDDIFIIRSSTRLFPLVINELKKTFPKARISCLTNQKAREGRSPLQYGVDHVIELPHTNGFCWRDIFFVRRILKPHSFDLAIVLYNSEKGLSYLNVDSFAFAAKPAYITCININKKEFFLTFPIFIGKICHRIIDFLWLLINIIFTFFVLIIIFLVMIISAPIAFFGKKH